MPFHLYFHLPYCRYRCPYCDFFKKVPALGDREGFVSALLAETKLAFSNHRWATGAAATVYFGGGTPSLHPPQEIAAILDQARRLWGIEERAEITLEANPGRLTSEWLEGWRDAGINRLSLGAQSFSARKLTLLVRDHQPADVACAVESARAAGLSNMSLDLIFGLPGETLEEWDADLSGALALEPEHISLYDLEFHEGTPFHRWRAAGRLQPLAEDFEAELYLHAHGRLTGAGFEHYEVSNFARPGFRSRHNLAYWESKPYVGLGPSAHSFDGGDLRFHNVADMNLYFEAVFAGRLPVTGEQRLSERERAEEWISLSLRRRDGIDFDAACIRLGEVAAKSLWGRAEGLPGSLCNLTGRSFSLTPEGWFRENSVLLWLSDFVLPPFTGGQRGIPRRNAD